MTELPGTKVFETVTGSHSYGTATKVSDVDTRGIFFPNNVLMFGMNPVESVKFDNEDTEYYTMTRFFQLALKMNPNILELLFAPKDCVKFTTKWWDYVVENRNMFLSQLASKTYTGYAHAQLKRMNTHVTWAAKPPAKPDPAKFGEQVDGNVIFHDIKLKKEYDRLNLDYQNYCDWRKNRNKYRAALEDEFKYDTKFAAHAVRISLQGKQLIETGELKVRLEGEMLEEVTNVRNGVFDYDYVVNRVKKIMEDMEMLLENSLSPLPLSPNVDALNRMLVDIHLDFLYNK